jgi:gliding motility-associated-like protein
MKKTLYILFTFISISSFAQFSKTHYIPPLTAQNNLAEDQFIYISTPSNADVSVKIIEIGGNTITRIITNSKPEIYPIGQGNDSRLFIPKASTGKVSNKGYIIEADDLIYVSVRVNAGFSTVNNSYNHAGGLVSKGNSALGKVFRLGAMLNPLYDTTLLNFASILSTENNTAITISNIPDGTVLSNGNIVIGPISITLNKNESYVLALENYPTSTSNSSKMIGALVESDKPVVVNSGSFCGSNSANLVPNQNGNLVPNGRDVGFDQIVPFDKTGTEYIFVKGAGTNELERVILIAHEPNTVIYLNGILAPYITLINAGDYVAIDGSQFSTNGSLYVSSSNKVFAYQCIGGSSTVYSPPANQNMFFVPPLNCATPNTVDNIPYIEQIGSINYTGGSLNIVTETGATVLINGDPVTALPTVIEGKSSFERYSIPNLMGNIAVKSSKQVYVSFYSSNGAATYGGYYSGFDTKPEITSEISIGATSSCIPNVVLKVSSITAYNTFEWSFNGEPISNSNANSYIPTQPGNYEVKGSITGCDSFYSDKIPVSNCPTNIDNDLANDNIDIDNDNDGITNCTESYGNQNIDLSNSTVGTVAVGTYSNSFTGFISTNGTGLPTGTFTGSLDGSFVTAIPAGKDNSVVYKITFTNAISLGMEYISSANPTNLLNADAEYIINSDTDKTITVLNPTDQLLIDTNYDGIYESGITKFSSFEIRFRLNSATPLDAGDGTFKFLTSGTNTISFTHKNLSDETPNKSSFKFFAVCVPKDSDGDGISDQLDSDSDNDGILDTIEAQTIVSLRLNADTNNDGLDNAFEPGFTPVDTDGDGIADYLDLDSDNDGIWDLVETGIDTDSDGIRNYRDLDSDNDLCTDVIESGFTDPDADGKFGNSPVSVNPNGLVSGAPYTIPHPNYVIAAPIVITSQPNVAPTCEFQNATITLIDNGVNSYQWQLSTNGTTWNDIDNNAPYSNALTNTLIITSVTNAMNDYKYRVQLSKMGNSCGLISNESTLTVYPLPNVTSSITLVQCDDDANGISDFNLTENNSFISSNLNDTFSYFTTPDGASNNDITLKILPPTAYRSGSGCVWARVENSNGCFKVAQINLVLSSTKIPDSYKPKFVNCDDNLDSSNDDTDGISTFDFSSVTSEIENLFLGTPAAYSIKYYKNEIDALAETNKIINISNYRNIGYPNSQQIWVRVESTIDNACYGIAPAITLTVNPKPSISTNEDHKDDTLVCSNLPTFYIQLNAGINDGSAESEYSYTWTKNGIILMGQGQAKLDVNTEGIYAVEVKSTAGCSRIRTIKITASDVANISSISIIDLSETNTITINTTGTGQYQYSLDSPSGPFQISNYFDNVSAGTHEVYVIDKNGCGTVSQTIAILGLPKYFTPNGDGFNDYWNVKGVNANFNSNSIIFIYDRYGKLITQINTSSEGWDGTCNGQALPSDDYWYTVRLEDGREAKGHFSLKR